MAESGVDYAAIEAALDGLISSAGNEITEQAKMNKEQLQKEAALFLNSIEMCQSVITQLENYYMEQKKKREALRANIKDPKKLSEILKSNEVYQQLSKKTWGTLKNNQVQAILKKFYNEAFRFQRALNTAVGQTVKMIFIAGGKNVGAYEMPMDASHLEFGFSSDGSIVGRYNFSAKAVEIAEASNQLINIGQQLEKELQLRFSLSGLNATYNEVLYRYRKSKAIAKARYIMWNLGGGWELYSVTSSGDLSEKYGGFVLNNKEYPKFESGMEQNVADFMTAGEQVDSTSGLLKGDISGENGTEYALKSNRATTLGLSQMKNAALEILNNQNFDIYELKARLESAPVVQHFKQASFDEADEKIQELTSAITSHTIRYNILH